MKTNTIFIFIIALITWLIAGGVALYMHTQMDKKIEVVKEYYAKEKQNSNFEINTSLSSKIETLSTQEIKIRNTFLNTDSIVGFIQQIENLAQNNSLEFTIEKVERRDIETIIDEQTIQPIAFYINTKGQYQNIKRFLDQVQSLDVITTISEFKLYKTVLENSEIEYNARIILSTNIFTYEKN